jgi:hypothetical protein
MSKNEEELYNAKLLVLYSESWKQYVHEDSMSHTKNTFFLSSHGAMLAVLTGVSSVLFNIDPFLYKCTTIYYGKAFLGVLAIVIGLIGIRINRYWCDVNEAHRAYTKARWLSAIAIESELKISGFGLANLEHHWKENTDANGFYPYSDIPELAEHKIDIKHNTEGYDSINAIIKLINILWWTIIICGMLSISFTIGFSFYNSCS